ncbi:hypothetical protein DFJ77DRAFT_505664 [Powellomyces hirtus]|nr:hypothetical protein DFJ77DRAFT_505664 [Powellomyces hirtus]
MAEEVLASSTSARLDQYVLLSKSAKGAACVQLIQDVLAAPGVYVFSELLETPSVLELATNPAHERYVSLLKLFAYGTYQDYKSNSANLPTLNEAQLKKLKHLSLVTLSGQNRTLGYDALLQYLDIPNVRELEDLVIDAIYQDLIRGKLDQKKHCLEVEYAMGRDLRPEEETRLLAVLGAWSRTSENMLQTIETNISNISQWTAHEAQEKDEHEKHLELMKKEVKKDGLDRHRPNMGGDGPSDFGDENGRRRLNKGRAMFPSRR